ncbi:MAG: 50S ribosomal protein L11 methyltransferase [Methylococcaceae bacterium]|nr:MAG: 50S ribosomal protein L11 methyltransferase [Methylococcaceae bacterium]
MAWRQISVCTDAASAEALSDWFSAQGALSVTLEDAADQPLYEPKPGETPLWQQTRVVALFEADVDISLLNRKLTAAFGLERAWQWNVATIEDQAWERAWLEHFKPMRFGRRLWVCPSSLTLPDEAAGGVCITLDPGLAFGTGTHPTTALCLAWLDGLDLHGKSVLDYGCGSGILAVGALLLGSAETIGVDIDPQALLASKDNAGKNAVADRLTCCYPEQLPAAWQADVVLANILANPLVELAPKLAGHCKPGGVIALSGLLSEQVEQVSQAYRPYFRLDPVQYQEGWALVSGIKVVT